MAQTLRYSPLDYSYELKSDDFNSMRIKGNINTVEFWTISNQNFHSKKDSIKEKSEKEDHQKFIFKKSALIKIEYYYKNGNIRAVQKFTDSLITEFSFFLEGDRKANVTTFEYQNKFLKKKTEITDKDEKVTEYFYNKEGYLELCKTGNIGYKYIYNSNQEFYQIRMFFPSQKIYEINYQKLNANKTKLINRNLILTENISFDSLNTLLPSFEQIREFDMDGNVLLEESYDKEELQYRKKSKYSSNKIIELSYQTKNGTNDKTIYDYNENGLLIKRTAFNNDNIINFNEVNSYNSNQDLISQNQESSFNGNEFKKYKYKYDINGNWIEKKEYINDKLFKTEYRIITYK
ncbi:hypothetical protein PXC01_18375 [Maribacter sp. M208]|uniref:hypothetical protein n=1 Tax=Maribacter huludaoensis TaxID=3030010 RepID=UPI0023EC66A8|nr:hypothetical protein [Maribacter huludaoensis]MDF4223569.1 hypothetical protein [Maribacter huludaoensis]